MEDRTMAIARFLECRVVSTSNIDSSNTQVIEGVPIANGDWVLLVGQIPKSQNGIWVAGTPWTRPLEAGDEQDYLGMTVVIREGAHAGTMWQCPNHPPIIVGTTDLAFAQLPNFVDKSRLDRLNAQQLASELPITDTDGDISIADGQRYKLPDGVLTMTRFRRLTNAGAAAGDKIYFRSEQKGSDTVAAYNSLIVRNASGAPILNILRQGLYIAEFDGAEWRGATPAGMQVFNVKDYGAIGDESITVYDTAAERKAVQECIDAAATYARSIHSSGTVVYFPPGIYRTDGDALILRRTPYNSPMVYLGAGGNSVTLMNATGIGRAGDVARVESLQEGVLAAQALGRPGTDSYIWGGERHLFQDLCFSGKHYGIN
jgi:hypothetical protein